MNNFQYLLLITVITHTTQRNPLAGLNTVELLKKHGYPVEVHHVTSADGYITALHRVPYGLIKDGRKRPAILIIPGLTSSSAEYINFGPGVSLGCILADSGLDVWISNNRGASWSRNHTYLDPDYHRKKYWDFSWHEIGYYDQPAIVDYILKLKRDKSLFYIGHSQGTTSFMVMTATRPEYNKKIKLAIMLAPSVLLRDIKSPVYTAIHPFMGLIGVLSRMFDMYELIPFRILNFLRKMMSQLCDAPENQKMFANLIHGLGYPDEPQLNLSKLSVIFSNTPTGASIKEFMHYYQIYETKIFAPYDYGIKRNLKKYGKKKPPPYNLSKITAPIAMYYSKRDAIIPIKEVNELMSYLPNVVKDYLVPYELFNHIDYLWASNAPDIVYKEILKDIQKYNK